jgi:hypothetical protein
MDKPTDIRSHSSADNKKSNQNPHLSDEQLLLALDGESSAHEAAQVEVHLEACWSCRTRREQIEKTIGDVVEYRDHLMKPYFPIPTGGRSLFVTRLEQLALSVGRPPLWNRVVRALRTLGAISQSLVPRYVWIGALVVASLALFSFTRLWRVPKVSASQLLENAQGSEVRALHSVAKPVVYQKLRIRVGGQTVTRTIYRDPVGMRQADRLDVAEGAGGALASNVGSPAEPQDQRNAVQNADAELRQTFLTAHLNWQNPLSPASYSAWYKSLGEKLDEVTTVGDGLITLKTTTSEGPIAEARITVRTSDFHPIAEDLRLKDTRQVEVHELAWEVLPMEAINVAIFAPEPALSPEIGRPSSVAPQPPGLTDAELAEAELRARVAIHAEKADLGEPIELDRDIPGSGQRSVVVRGIVSTPERKNNLLAVLRGIPHIEFRLQTVEEAQSQLNQVTEDQSQGAAPQIAQEVPAREYRVAGGNVEATRHETPALVIAGKPALEQQLEEQFPNSEDRAAFVNETVELVQDAMAQAWALRRLGNRYTPDTVTELSSGSQQTLELLIRDHVSVLRQDVDGVRNRISPLLSPMPVTAVTRPHMPDALLPAAGTASDWRSTVIQVFSETQRVHDDGVALLAGSGEAFFEAQAVARELQLTLTELETQLPALYQQVSGPFLSEVRNSSR